jgi:hypothetical protein
LARIGETKSERVRNCGAVAFTSSRVNLSAEEQLCVSLGLGWLDVSLVFNEKPVHFDVKRLMSPLLKLDLAENVDSETESDPEPGRVRLTDYRQNWSSLPLVIVHVGTGCCGFGFGSGPVLGRSEHQPESSYLHPGTPSLRCERTKASPMHPSKTAIPQGIQFQRLQYATKAKAILATMQPPSDLDFLICTAGCLT